MATRLRPMTPLTSRKWRPPRLLSRRKRLIILLGELRMARSALKGPPPTNSGRVRGTSRTSSVALYEDAPHWGAFPFTELERALQDLKRDDNRAYYHVWRVYCERMQRPSHIQMRHALRGLKAIESSPHMPGHVAIPAEAAIEHGRRPRSHLEKREQNKEIRRMIAHGHTHDEVAFRFGISRQRVGQIVKEAA